MTSSERLEFLKERISIQHYYFICFDTMRDAIEATDIFEKRLHFRVSDEEKNTMKTSNYNLQGDGVCVEVHNGKRNQHFHFTYRMKSNWGRDMFPTWSEHKNIILDAYGINPKPNYMLSSKDRKKRFIYEGKLDNLKGTIINDKGLFILPDNKESIKEVIDVLKTMNINLLDGFPIDKALEFEFGQGSTLLFFIVNNKGEQQFGYVLLTDDIEKTLKGIEDVTILYPEEKYLLNILYKGMPNYMLPREERAKRFVTESVDIRIGIKCNTRQECVDFEKHLHKNGWVYENGGRYIVKRGTYDNLLFFQFNADKKTFTAMEGSYSSDVDIIYDNLKDKYIIDRKLGIKIVPNYMLSKEDRKKRFIRESKESKTLWAFDMDDTLVYSKRFEDHVKPMLLREYLTPEVIMNNKLDDIGIGIEELKYEDGRIYFDDPNEEVLIPNGSSWVRKKGRIYIIQPDAYFMTDESMPIGAYKDIVRLYNESENRCIITARNERLKTQTEKVLKELGVDKPNIGLYMYPSNSFSRTYEYKCNRLMRLQNRYNFDEIKYYDDNIKLLKKMKEHLKDKDIPVTFYKVTKNRYRKL